MSGFVLAVGILVLVASLVLMARPQQGSGLLNRIFNSHWLYAAALARLLLGAGLIASADSVRFSAAVNVLGWLAVLGGLGLVVIPPALKERLTERFAGLTTGWMRLWLCAGLLFGLFLVYAALG